MNPDEEFSNRRFLSNGQRLLEKFYTNRRRSLEDPHINNQVSLRNKQRAQKRRLSAEYIRLVKENTYLREFIKKYHLKIKEGKVESILDGLRSETNHSILSTHMDTLHKKISNTFIYF